MSSHSIHHSVQWQGSATSSCRSSESESVVSSKNQRSMSSHSIRHSSQWQSSATSSCRSSESEVAVSSKNTPNPEPHPDYPRIHPTQREDLRDSMRAILDNFAKRITFHLPEFQLPEEHHSFHDSRISIPASYEDRVKPRLRQQHPRRIGSTKRRQGRVFSIGTSEDMSHFAQQNNGSPQRIPPVRIKRIFRKVMKKCLTCVS